MGQPLRCDGGDCDLMADAIVSQIANGDTVAYCADHFLAFCESVFAQAAADEADATVADVASRMDGVTAPSEYPTSDASSDEAIAAVELRSKRDKELGERA